MRVNNDEEPFHVARLLIVLDGGRLLQLGADTGRGLSRLSEREREAGIGDAGAYISES